MVLWIPSGVRNRYVHRDPSYWRDLLLLLSPKSPSESPLERPRKLPLIQELDYIAQALDPLAIDCSQAQSAARTMSARLQERQWEALLSRAERFARHHHPHDLMDVAQRVARQKNGHVKLVRGHNSGSVYLALQVQHSGRTYRALISLGDAKEQRRAIPLQRTQHAGFKPWWAAVLLERNRTFVSIRCRKESR